MSASRCDKRTLLIWERRWARLHPETQRRAYIRLAMLNRAASLDDLRVPPGNRLEQLKGDRVGQYSIRVNQQWRICFRWTDAGPEAVEFTDYH
ncbi:proteic killer suppression protein [Saccharopolyspora antimicrobica]|uniref:Proteic killer suppression protein n=2 Tax=Saccharopolyspora antimicrobica TaxID=455193 RepID=A0ABX9TCJ1_9PSEU|nr:proteic killer suppression protein [Saccharopolyspora antimicrobica]